MLLNRQRVVPVSLPPLSGFIDQLRGALRLDHAEFNACLVSDASIARMNRTFRKRRGPTDVLSFPSGELEAGEPGKQRKPRRPRKQRKIPHAPDGSRPQDGHGATSSALFASSNSSASCFLGDIAISPQTARRNARRSGRTLANELRVLILHGLLHLLGYDHETDEGEMTRLEGRLRRRFGLR